MLDPVQDVYRPSRLSKSVRMTLAVFAGYLVNGILVAITEWLLALSRTAARPLSYFVIDLVSQCLFTVVGGYVCRSVARTPAISPLIALIALALVIGSWSLTTSWKAEPHWYGISLLVTFPLCAWVGWWLRDRRTVGG